MKTLEKGKDKIQQICDVLRKDTIEPAQQEAKGLIEQAHADARKIIDEAREEAENMIRAARSTIEQERSVFESSLSQAARQSKETLRQEVEKIFNQQLSEKVTSASADSSVVAKVLSSVVEAVSRDGLSADLVAVIPSSVSQEEVLSLMSAGTAEKLQAGGINLGGVSGGAQLQLRDRKITIDLSDQALNELLASFVRKDLRKYLFAK
ncbi:MAG: V-type ATP synthase subunit E [Waddliaceae bacterium]|nr:V-type ATP synthase subunit E [Waddliaceae bacterium]